MRFVLRQHPRSFKLHIYRLFLSSVSFCFFLFFLIAFCFLSTINIISFWDRAENIVSTHSISLIRNIVAESRQAITSIPRSFFFFLFFFLGLGLARYCVIIIHLAAPFSSIQQQNNATMERNSSRPPKWCILEKKKTLSPILTSPNLPSQKENKRQKTKNKEQKRGKPYTRSDCN